MHPALENFQDVLLDRLLDAVEDEQTKPRIKRVALLRRPIRSTPASAEAETHDADA